MDQYEIYLICSLSKTNLAHSSHLLSNARANIPKWWGDIDAKFYTMQGPIWNCQVIYNLDNKFFKIGKSSLTNISQKRIKIKAEKSDEGAERRWVKVNSIYHEPTSLGECIIKLPRACENITTPDLP